MEDLLGLLLRATITYVYLLAIVRLSGKRTIKEGTPFDLLVALMIGDMPDNIIWGETPVAQGLVAMGSVMLLHLLVVYASYRSIAFDRLVGSRPEPAIENGELVRRTMALERLNEEELWALLRQQRIEERRDVETAMLEPDGVLSIRRRKPAKPAEKRDKPALLEALL